MLPPDIEVIIREGYHVSQSYSHAQMWPYLSQSSFLCCFQESQYAGKTGMVRAILNRMASIYLYDDGREIDVPCRYVEPVAPNKLDKVNYLF